MSSTRKPPPVPAGRRPTKAAARPPAPPAWKWARRTGEVGWVLLPLRAFLGFVFLYGGISKIADRSFLSATSPKSMHASIVIAQHISPVGSLLGPVERHAYGFGIVMAFAELSVALGTLLGLFTRIAAVGGVLTGFSLWLTVSWNASPWFTSADLVYLFAFTPLLIAGAGGVYSVDAWLAEQRRVHPGVSEDRTRRVLVAGGAAFGGLVLLGGASLFRRSPTSQAASPNSSGTTTTPSGSESTPTGADTASNGSGGVVLAAVADVPVGGGKQVQDSQNGEPAWVLQLSRGNFTAYSAICPHQGCTVEFISAKEGFACPCHFSTFNAQGGLTNGPATSGLSAIPVVADGSDIRTK
jgi:thiosulfate dehydrogenase (quinone) large subunit